MKFYLFVMCTSSYIDRDLKIGERKFSAYGELLSIFNTCGIHIIIIVFNLNCFCFHHNNIWFIFYFLLSFSQKYKHLIGYVSLYPYSFACDVVSMGSCTCVGGCVCVWGGGGVNIFVCWSDWALDNFCGGTCFNINLFSSVLSAIQVETCAILSMRPMYTDLYLCHMISWDTAMSGAD